ncbi:MAG TPA: beta-L-arabinofuranosidase domain-containing protein [Bryobacteraceae bacterium]|nr:beta-L-arabinofuranosidase domain-containing protein [Bryobacteraceae bacterium]
MSDPTKTPRVNRRSFAAILAATSAATPAVLAQQTPQTPPPAGAPNPNTSVQQQQQQRRMAPPEAMPFDAPIEFTRKDIPLKALPFPMTQVRLLPGSIFHDAQEWNRGYMSRLPVDRLVYNFRANAGLPTGETKPFGGWEMKDDGNRGSELRGHFTGHFLSASANLWASTGDQAAKTKGDELVAELAKCQEKLGGGYLSAFPMSLFERLDRLSGRPFTPRPQGEEVPVSESLPWAPFYTIHKIMAGMFDMYRLADNQQALKVLEGMAGWADEWSGSKTEAHMQEILMTEYGGMAEVLYNLAAATNNERWAKVGDRYTKKWFFNPLALHRDELNKDPFRGFPLHANTHIPQVIGAARRYEISGDMRFHDVADFFYYTVSTGRTYVTGGTSNGESWNGSPRHLSAEWKRNISTAECCCSYNMMKLARHLYSWDPDPRYFDYYERTLMNERIGTIRPEKGYTQYYLSLTPGAWKTFNSEDQSFWCCTGTGVEEYSKLNDSIYWHDDKGVYVNLFIPSELNWAEKGIKLRQENQFPEKQSTSFVITANAPTPMALRLRIPEWLNGGTVKINGKPLEVSATPGSYLTINRTWHSKDRVEMDLPMQLRVETMPDDPKTQAFLYGPLVLAGDLGDQGLTERLIIGPNAPRMRPPNAPPRANANPNAPQAVPPLEVPALKAASADPSSWIKPGDKPLTFHTTGQEKDVTLVPINTLFDKRYSVYWQVS